MWNATKGSCKNGEKTMRTLSALQAPKSLTPKAILQASNKVYIHAEAMATSLQLLYL